MMKDGFSETLLNSITNNNIHQMRLFGKSFLLIVHTGVH